MKIERDGLGADLDDVPPQVRGPGPDPLMCYYNIVLELLFSCTFSSLSASRQLVVSGILFWLSEN